jgi:hypothetical protein
MKVLNTTGKHHYHCFAQCPNKHDPETECLLYNLHEETFDKAMKRWWHLIEKNYPCSKCGKVEPTRVRKIDKKEYLRINAMMEADPSFVKLT